MYHAAVNRASQRQRRQFRSNRLQSARIITVEQHIKWTKFSIVAAVCVKAWPLPIVMSALRSSAANAPMPTSI